MVPSQVLWQLAWLKPSIRQDGGAALMASAAAAWQTPVLHNELDKRQDEECIFSLGSPHPCCLLMGHNTQHMTQKICYSQDEYKE